MNNRPLSYENYPTQSETWTDNLLIHVAYSTIEAIGRKH